MGELIFKFKGKKKSTSQFESSQTTSVLFKGFAVSTFYSVQDSGYVDEATHMRKEQSALLSLQTPSQPHAK